MAPKKKPKFAYSHEQLLAALEDVKKGASVNSASKRHGIPQSTLAYKVSGKTPLERRQGPQPLLGTKCEEMLVNWVSAMAVKGFPITKTDLLTSATQIVKEIKPEVKDLKLGKKWLSLFLQRHPQITERKPEKLSKVRATVSEKCIHNWFTEVKTTLDEMNASNVLEDPSRIFNLDETAVFLCPKTGKVLGLKGQKNVYEVHSGSDKENLTVLCIASANGTVAPTLIVFPGQRLPSAERLMVPDDWAIAKSESGWINGTVFFEYIVNTFFVWITENQIQLPVIVFMDGHNSHLTYHLSVYCAKYQIILIALPPNCTHVLQPMDVAVFKPVKQEWSSIVHKWRMSHYHESLTKFNFALLFKEALDTVMKPDTLKNGFKRCGLSPFDVTAVDFSKVDVFNNVVPKKPIAGNQIPTQPSCTNERENSLKFLESFIPPDLLEQFQETYERFTPIWNGVESAQDLYVVWKKVKDSLQTNVNAKSDQTTAIEKSSTVEEPVPAIVTVDEPVPSTSWANHESSTPKAPRCHNEQLIDQGSLLLSPEQNPDLARQEALAKVLSPDTNGEGVPTPLKKHLSWPGTPVKTGKSRKRKDCKIPAVIVSKKYIELKEKEREEKKQIELEKAERKRLREMKKLNKSEKSTKTKDLKRKIVFDEEDDWKCLMCKKRFSAEQSMNIRRRWIECDQCKETFHYSCIPKKHRDTFGIEESDEDDDELSFICHMCANDIDSDCEEFVLSESDNE